MLTSDGSGGLDKTGETAQKPADGQTDYEAGEAFFVADLFLVLGKEALIVQSPAPICKIFSDCFCHVFSPCDIVSLLARLLY